MGRRRPTPPPVDRDGAARRRARRRQGPVLHGGRAQPGRLAHPRGLPAAVHRDLGREAARGAARRCSARPTRTSSRWAPRRRTRATGRRSTRGTRRACRAARRAARPPRSPPGRAPWAIGTDTGGSIRQPAALCGIVGLKPTYGAVCRYGMIAFASSLDQAGPFTRDVTDAALLLRRDGRQGPVRLDVGRAARGRSRCRSAPTCEGVRLGVPEELTGEGIEPGRARRLRGDARPRAASSAPTVEPCRLPHAPHALAAYYLIAPAEASSQPRALRRRPLRLPRADGDDDLLRCTRETRDQGFGAEVKRRIMLGTYALSSGYYDAYYGRAQKVRTMIAQDFNAAWERFDFVVTPTEPDRRLRARRQDRRPARDVPQRLLHRADAARRHPGDLDPQRAQRGPADRLPARRAGVQRERACSTPRTRSSRRSASTPRPGAGLMSARGLGARHRAGDPRPARHADEDVLRLRADASASRPTRAPARSASGCPARCR